jgi:DNA-binding MarR family transcriptional regulator
MSAEDRLPFANQLRRAQFAYRLALERALGSTGITAPQFAAMARLRETPGLSNAELARRSLVTPQTMNLIVGRLESAGLVVRKPHPGHGRILLAELTPAGLALLDQCHARAESVEACAIGALDASERPRLLEYLARVSNALGGAGRGVLARDRDASR